MILVIHRSKSLGYTKCDVFRYMGIIAVPKTPYEALAEANPHYSAALIFTPDAIAAEDEYTKKLRTYLGTSPVFALKTTDMKHPELYDAVYNEGLSTSRICKQLLSDCKRLGVRVPGVYKLAGLDVSAGNRAANYFGRLFHLTRTELAITRYLTIAYPRQVSANELLKYLFKPSKMPLPSDVRSHISKINRKFVKIAERRLIVSSRNGYSILTPEMFDKPDNEEVEPDIPRVRELLTEK